MKKKPSIISFKELIDNADKYNLWKEIAIQNQKSTKK